VVRTRRDHFHRCAAWLNDAAEQDVVAGAQRRHGGLAGFNADRETARRCAAAAHTCRTLLCLHRG